MNSEERLRRIAFYANKVLEISLLNTRVSYLADNIRMLAVASDQVLFANLTNFADSDLNKENADADKAKTSNK